MFIIAAIMNPFEMLKDIKNLKNYAETIKKNIDGIVVEGTSGGGLVKITLGGDFHIKSIFLDPIAVDNRDVAMLQDLIKAAHTDAWNKLKEEINKNFGPMTSELSL